MLQNSIRNETLRNAPKEGTMPRTEGKLPEGFSVRPATPEDVGAVARLVMATDWAEFFDPESVEAEISEDWRGSAFDFERDSWLVFAPNGEFVASAELFHQSHARMEVSTAVHPGYSGVGIGGYFIRVTGERAGEHAPLAPPETRVVLQRVTNAANEEARKLLTNTGHALVRNFWTMEIEVGEGLAPPTWPENVSVRECVRGEDERLVYETQRETFRDHWDEHEETFEEWRRHMVEGPSYDPSLWFVAESDAGEVAGISLCRSASTTKGWVAVLGVRRGWRRRGLGEALLRHSFREMRRRGKTTVELGVDSESLTGATRLYERAGMKVARRVAVYEKELRPATEREQ
jgi:mycothiol synthase